MPTSTGKPKTTYTPAPEGTQIARCIQLIQIGTIQEEYMGKPKMMNKIRLSFELPLKTKVWKEGEPAKPIVIHKEYTFSMAEKANLRKLVEGMIGTTLKDEEAYAFDVESLVGMACIINIKHKTSTSGNVRDEIASAAPLMEGMTCPAQFNPSNILTFNSWNEDKFELLPDFLKEKIMESEEYKVRLVPLTPQDKEQIQALRNAENAGRATAEAVSADLEPDNIDF